MALLCYELTEQLAQRFGDEGRACERREMVAGPFCHGPAQFPCLRRLVLVCLAQLKVSSRRAGPLRRRRVNFLDMATGSRGGAGSEVPPRSGTGNQPGQGLALGISDPG
jgi:hypothetical protein